MPSGESRPQDRVRLVAEGDHSPPPITATRPVLLSVLVSLPLLGYFWWYWQATRDCARLLDQDIDPWAWLCMVFPGMLLVLPYIYAQVKLVARIEVATREPLNTPAYVAVCMAGVLAPFVLPLVLQARLNRAARSGADELRARPLPA